MACVGGPLEAVGPLRQAALQEFDVADDDGEQVVEIVGDAAGELANGLHLLGLPQSLLGLQALGDLLRDPLLQGLVQALEFLGWPAPPSGGQGAAPARTCAGRWH